LLLNGHLAEERLGYDDQRDEQRRCRPLV
jgi:hypothetical protein